MWISAVGRGGLYPIARLGNFDDVVSPQGDYMLDADTPGTPAADVIFAPRPALPSAWWVLVASALAVIGAHLLAQYSALAGRPDALPRFFFSFREPALQGGLANVASHHAHAASASFVLVAAAFPLLLVNLMPHLTSPANECPHAAVDLGAALVLGVAAVALLVAAFVHLWLAAMRRDSARPALRHVVAPIVVPIVWLFLVIAATVEMGAANIGLDGPAWRAILCARVGAVGSGLSPLTPALFFTAALYVWHLGQVQRIRELSSMGDLRVYKVFARAGEAHADIEILENRLYEVLSSACPASLRAPLALLFVGVVGVEVLLPPLSTLEPSAWVYRFFLVAITVIFLGSWLMLGTLAAVWRRLTRLLWRLAHDPMVDAYRRLPNSYVRVLENQLSGDVPDARDLHVALRELELLDNNRDSIPGVGTPPPATPARSAPEPISKLWDQFFKERRRGAEAGAIPFPVGESQAAEGLVDRAAVLRCELEAQYATRSLTKVSDSMKDGEGSAITAATSPDVASKSTLGLTNPRLKPESELWLRMAEELVACVVTLLVYPLVRHFRNLLSVATGIALLLMMGVASYSFQPRRAFMFGVGAVIVGVAVTAVSILVGLDRNELLSRIGKTTPGRVTFDRRFLLGVVSWGLLPVLSLLAVQYPEVVARVLSFLQPMASQGH
jgi:hypothetical protein